MIYTGKVYKGKVKISELESFCGYEIDIEDDIEIVEALTDYLREENGEDFSEEYTDFEIKGDLIYYESETCIADGVEDEEDWYYR